MTRARQAHSVYVLTKSHQTNFTERETTKKQSDLNVKDKQRILIGDKPTHINSIAFRVDFFSSAFSDEFCYSPNYTSVLDNCICVLVFDLWNSFFFSGQCKSIDTLQFNVCFEQNATERFFYTELVLRNYNYRNLLESASITRIGFVNNQEIATQCI